MNAIVAFQVSDIERMARALATSKLFGVREPEQALALCLIAQAEGRHPASAANDYHIISGRPAKKADAMLRDFIASGGKVEWHALTDEKAEATFSHPAGGSVRIDWTMQRAKQAGINTPMWSKYPRQMLRSRTVSEGVRTVCPGATSGMYVPEEVQDIVSEVQEPVNVTPQAEPASQRLSAAEAKRRGIHTEINAEIDALDLAGVRAWFEDFDELTANLPLAWLDPLRDRLELRREELMAGPSEQVVEQIAAMDEGFRQTVGGREDSVAGHDNHNSAAA